MIVFKEIKLKYEVLDTLLDDIVKNIRYSPSINIIIDLKEVLRKIFRPDILPEAEVRPFHSEEIASDIINIISHYRNYFFKKGKYTSFFFVYSKDECALMKTKYSGYKSEFYQKYFYDPERSNRISVVKKAVEVAQRVINQVPNARFIDSSKYDELSIIKFIIQKTDKDELNFIFSNDEIMAQLINDHTFIIDIRGNNSSLINEVNGIQSLLKINSKLSTKMIPLIAAITGTERYSLSKINHVGNFRATKIVEHLVSRGKILDNEYIVFPLALEDLDKKIRNEEIIIDNFEQIKSNFNIIMNSDTLYTNEVDIATLFNKPKQIYPLNHFLEVNAKVFASFPLSIDMLLKGEAF